MTTDEPNPPSGTEKIELPAVPVSYWSFNKKARRLQTKENNKKESEEKEENPQTGEKNENKESKNSRGGSTKAAVFNAIVSHRFRPDEKVALIAHLCGKIGSQNLDASAFAKRVEEVDSHANTVKKYVARLKERGGFDMQHDLGSLTKDEKATRWKERLESRREYDKENKKAHDEFLRAKRFIEETTAYCMRAQQINASDVFLRSCAICMGTHENKLDYATEKNALIARCQSAQSTLTTLKQKLQGTREEAILEKWEKYWVALQAFCKTLPTTRKDFVVRIKEMIDSFRPKGIRTHNRRKGTNADKTSGGDVPSNEPNKPFDPNKPIERSGAAKGAFEVQETPVDFASYVAQSQARLQAQRFQHNL